MQSMQQYRTEIVRVSNIISIFASYNKREKNRYTHIKTTFINYEKL